MKIQKKDKQVSVLLSDMCSVLIRSSVIGAVHCGRPLSLVHHIVTINMSHRDVMMCNGTLSLTFVECHQFCCLCWSIA